jgi:hypothetical protein
MLVNPLPFSYTKEFWQGRIFQHKHSLGIAGYNLYNQGNIANSLDSPFLLDIREYVL